MNTNNFSNMNFDQNSFTNLLSTHQSPTPQQNIQQYLYQQQNPPQQFALPTQNNQNPLVGIMNANQTANNTNNGMFQTLNLPPQLVQQQQQQVQQIQQQQLLAQQQRRSYTQQQIREVQGLIEKCLTQYLTKDEVIVHLAHIEPYVIKLVWLKLEEQNPEFFHSYNIRLQIKSQIDMFNTLVKDQASLMSQQQQQVGTSQQPSNATGSTPLRQTPTQSNPPSQNQNQTPQGQYGNNASTLNIYNLLQNNQTSNQNIRNPSPYQPPQQNQPQGLYMNQNQYQPNQLLNQRLGSLGSQSQTGGQRLGSLNANDMSYLLMNQNADLSALLQQPQQNQFQGPMGGQVFSQYGNNSQQDQLSMLLAQTQQQSQNNQYNQFTGPGGGGLNGSVEQQSLNILQQYGNTGNGYNQLQNFQFPQNTSTGGMNLLNMQNSNKPMNQENRQQNAPMSMLGNLLEDNEFNNLESNFNIDNTSGYILNELDNDNTFSSESGEDQFSSNDPSSYQIL